MYRFSLFLTPILLFFSMDAFTQESENAPSRKPSKVSHNFYITSNIGNVSFSEAGQMLEAINQHSRTDEEATLLIIGNIVSEKGFPSKDKDQKEAKEQLSKLMKVWDGFNGKVILTPGQNEWTKDAPQSIDELESYLQDNSKAKFWPNDGCSHERETINDEVVLEIVDSQWFLEDWDEHPYINEKCEHKTRDEFLAEFKDDIKDSQGKTVVVAVYQPVMSNTKINPIDKMGGFSPDSYQNAQNRLLRGRLETIASQFEDVIFVSGKDRNLQYLSDDGIPQIISGAIGKTDKARAKDEGNYATERNGFARLTVFQNGSSEVSLFALKDDSPPSENESSELVFTQRIKRERPSLDKIEYPEKTGVGTESASIYTDKEIDKSGLYKWFWGDHYRNLYADKIEAPVLRLEDLPENPKAISEGGGTQSRSLRLKDDNDNEYTLRALRKSAVRFLQTTAIKDHYVADYFKNTIAERTLLDFYTTSHPYAQFAMPELSESVAILHANPKIYYVPKQKNLGVYNEDYGNALFMFEEHAGDENKDFETFGKPDDILSTSDLRSKLLESKESFVDQSSYIRARLFDQLTGNWDRHQDQWRWAEFNTEDGKKRYEPIPRDWDQVFPKYDGAIISLAKLAFPLLRKMQTYDPDVKNLKWFNFSGYPLDKLFIQNATWQDWQNEIDYIKSNLTDTAIDSAFATLPKTMQDESISEIKKNLRSRRDKLESIAQRYYTYLNRHEIILGTEDKEEFTINRKPDGITEIRMMDKNDTLFNNSYDARRTKEIWIYGLDGKDTFTARGKGTDLIKIKVLGGKENDTYDFSNPKKIKLYDYKSKKNTITNSKSKKWLTDSYDINNYDYQKRKYTENVLLPSFGYDRDSGFRIGLKNRFRTYGLTNNPFTTQHTIGAEYFFATNGFAVKYSPEFAQVFYGWNLGFDLRYSSPNFTMNFFGEGNGSIYEKEETDFDFNRVRIRQWSVSPYLAQSDSDNRFTLRSRFESNTVSDDDERFVGQVFEADNDVFDTQNYVSAEVGYHYLNQDNPAFPSRGMELDVKTGYTSNIDGNDNRFGYVKPMLSLTYPLHPSGMAVVATKISGHTLLGNDYEFYHGATLGGNQSLRAYRNERFNGKTAFSQSTDVRVGVKGFRTNFVPLQLGFSLGFDYGRVWTEEEEAEKWHNDFGGSLWINGFSALTGNFGFYHGDEGNRFIFSLGFNF